MMGDNTEFKNYPDHSSYALCNARPLQTPSDPKSYIKWRRIRNLAGSYVALNCLVIGESLRQKLNFKMDPRSPTRSSHGTLDPACGRRSTHA